MSRNVFNSPSAQQSDAASSSPHVAAAHNSLASGAASSPAVFALSRSPSASLPPQSFPAFYSSQSVTAYSASLLPSPPPLLPKLSSSSSACSPPAVLYAQHSAAGSCSSHHYLEPSSVYPPLRLTSSPDYLSALQSFPLQLTPPPPPLPGPPAAALPSAQRFPAVFPPTAQPCTYAAVGSGQQQVAYGASVAAAAWESDRHERSRDSRPASRCLHPADALQSRSRARADCSCGGLLYADYGSSFSAASASALYRTELCSSESMSVGCVSGGSGCARAHSLEELRPVYYDSKYKTELCKRFHVLGPDGCRFGTRCKFLHDEVRVKASDGEYWLCSEREGIIRVEVVPLHHFHRRQLLDQLTFCPPAGPVSPLSASPRPQHRRFSTAAPPALSPAVAAAAGAASPAALSTGFSSFAPYSFSPALHASPALSTRSLPLHFNEQLPAAAAAAPGQSSSSTPLRTRRLG